MSSDAPPKLTELPQHSAFEVPTLSSTEPAITESEPVTTAAAPEEPAPVNETVEPVEPTTTTSESAAPSTLATAKESVINSKSSPPPTLSSASPSAIEESPRLVSPNIMSTDAQAAYGAVANHPTTQAVKDTVANGPVAEGIKNQTAKTNSDIQGLANARTTPEASTTNGQPLTHYHSFFYSLLSWEHPRATAISFASTIALIFAARYLPLLRWFFKVAYVVLGVTAAAEIAGRLTINQGLASSFRPRRYYTIPRESLEAVLEDVEQLINFFVIEFQRVIFAENVAATVATFVAAFLSYWLIKWLPLWGLSLIAATTVYLAPFIYINNREMIDGHLNHAHGVISAQATQVRDLAGQHTGRATDSLKQYAGDYSAKAQSLLNNRGGMSSTVKSEEFPAAPQHEPVKTESGAEPVAAY